MNPDCADEAYVWASDDCTGDIGFILNKPNSAFSSLKVTQLQLGAFDDMANSFIVPTGYMLQIYEHPFGGKTTTITGDCTCVSTDDIQAEVSVDLSDDVTSMEYRVA